MLQLRQKFVLIVIGGFLLHHGLHHLMAFIINFLFLGDHEGHCFGVVNNGAVQCLNFILDNLLVYSLLDNILKYIAAVKLILIIFVAFFVLLVLAHATAV